MLVISGGAAFGAIGLLHRADAAEAAPSLLVAPHLPLVPGQESTLEIRIAPEEAIPPRSLIVIRGAPAGIGFSQGRAFGPGVWVIPAAKMVTLKLIAPKDYRSGGVISVALAKPDGTAIAEVLVALMDGTRMGVPVNTPPQPLPRAQKTITVSPPAAAGQAVPPAQPKLTAEKRDELYLLLQKGKDSLRIGNIMHARQFFLRAAESGLPEAALALAATYDPVELARMTDVAGVIPDPALARKWYEKARELGSPEAEARLSALSRR